MADGPKEDKEIVADRAEDTKEKTEETVVDQDVLEEDDDFEEFEDEDFGEVKPAPEEELQWEDNWDDEEDDDDFAKRLRDELAKQEGTKA